jgi:hypothetical protein
VRMEATAAGLRTSKALRPLVVSDGNLLSHGEAVGLLPGR